MSQAGYDYPCMSFLYSYVLLLVAFLTLCIFVVGSVTYVYMCDFLVDWVQMCFRSVCSFVCTCVLFSSLHFVFFVFRCLVVSPRIPMRTL